MISNTSLQIDEVETAGGGVIGMCACPGRNQPNSDAKPRWQRCLDEDLSDIKRWKPDYVLTLVEEFELEDLGVPGFGSRIRDAGISWIFLPTKNLCAPDFSSRISSIPVDVFLDETLRTGGRILIHCAAGKGRTGTLASALLIRQGRTASQAIKDVRTARPGTIESSAQLEFLFLYENEIGAPTSSSQSLSRS